MAIFAPRIMGSMHPWDFAIMKVAVSTVLLLEAMIFALFIEACIMMFNFILYAAIICISSDSLLSSAVCPFTDARVL